MKINLISYKSVHSLETQEGGLSDELEIQKKLLGSIDQLESESALKVAREVENKLKKLFSDSKNFKNVRSKIGRYLVNEVQPLITRLVDENLSKQGTINNSPDKENTNPKSWKLEFIEIIQIKENDTGFPFEKIFTKERVGPKVTQILIEDPYLITKEQITILYIFIIAMKHNYKCLEYVEVKTKSTPGKSDVYKDLSRKFPNLTSGELLSKEFEAICSNLNYIKNKCKDRGINFEFKFGNSSMHERRIFFNSGVVAHPGRGLSIYQIDCFKDGRNLQDLPCKECNIPIFRLKDWNIETHNLSHFQ